jgi:hypothetical protein
VSPKRVTGKADSVRTEFPDKSSLPSSKKNSDLRVKTYGSWWPHSKPTPKQVSLPHAGLETCTDSIPQLAEGGFIYAPSVTSPDATRCLLCDYEVEDWEKGDNPK